MKNTIKRLAIVSATFAAVFAATQAQAYDGVSDVYVTVPNYSNKPLCLGAYSMPSGTKMKAGCKPEWKWFSRHFNSAPGDTEVVLVQYKDKTLTEQAELLKVQITGANTKVRTERFKW